ncbi:bacA [Symbiodinium microadriaticum]|nr:bacA [Symbiodinium microadriaticum]
MSIAADFVLTSTTSGLTGSATPNTAIMNDGVGWGGYSNVPEAAPAPPSPMNNDVQLIMQNILRLQCMVPKQAEKILRDTAALQFPYQD